MRFRLFLKRVQTAHTGLSFNVHGVIYIDYDGAFSLRSYQRLLLNPLIDTVAPIEREIRTLANGLTSVKDEQEYIVVRERTHRNTAESTNERVKWWSVAQVIILFAVVAWQVYYLKVRLLVSHYRCGPECSTIVILRSQACLLGLSGTSFVLVLELLPYCVMFCNLHHSHSLNIKSLRTQYGDFRRELASNLLGLQRAGCKSYYTGSLRCYLVT